MYTRDHAIPVYTMRVLCVLRDQLGIGTMLTSLTFHSYCIYTRIQTLIHKLGTFSTFITRNKKWIPGILSLFPGTLLTHQYV